MVWAHSLGQASAGWAYGAICGTIASMPAISIFFGIVIRMFYNDHDPVHFHAEYQGQRAKFDLNGRMVAGNIGSKTALRLIKQWATQHEAEIRANWRRVKTGKPLQAIEPLR